MFGMGATLTFSDFARVLKMPGAIVVGMILQFTVMPLGGWLLASISQLPPEIAAGVILVGACPGGVSSNVITYLAKGNVALSVTMTACSTFQVLQFRSEGTAFVTPNRTRRYHFDILCFPPKSSFKLVAFREV